eukprot:c25565_g1_i1 orf=487-1197(-)
MPVDEEAVIDSPVGKRKVEDESGDRKKARGVELPRCEGGEVEFEAGECNRPCTPEFTLGEGRKDELKCASMKEKQREDLGEQEVQEEEAEMGGGEGDGAGSEEDEYEEGDVFSDSNQDSSDELSDEEALENSSMEEGNSPVKNEGKGKGIMSSSMGKDDKGKGKTAAVETSDDSSNEGVYDEDDASDLSDDPLDEVDLSNILPTRTRGRPNQPTHFNLGDLKDEDDDDDDDDDSYA